MDAHLGRASRARRWAEEGLDLAATTGAAFGRLLSVSALGFLELSEGNARGAVGQLLPLAAQLDAGGVGEPGVMRFVPDAVEALLMLGDFAQAEACSSITNAGFRRSLARRGSRAPDAAVACSLPRAETPAPPSPASRRSSTEMLSVSFPSSGHVPSSRSARHTGEHGTSALRAKRSTSRSTSSRASERSSGPRKHVLSSPGLEAERPRRAH